MYVISHKKIVISKDKFFFVYDQKFPRNGVTNTTKFFSFYEEKVCFLFDQTIYIYLLLKVHIVPIATVASAAAVKANSIIYT